MADIELVIKIPEEKYKWIKDHKGKTDFQTTELLYRRIGNGIPLPKGHGRLIDADTLLKEHRLFDTYPFPSTTIDSAPTIIEADKGSEEV